MFRIRAVLASMLTPSWGIYAGYELYEHIARPGAEEYLDNEKYELRPRDWAAAERSGQSLAPYIAQLNRIRRENPAMHWLRNLRFHDLDNDTMLCWSKRDQETGNTVLVICTLDPFHDQWVNTTLDMPALGFDWHERFTVVDELTGAKYQWGQHNAVHLDPYVQPAHVFTVHRIEPEPEVVAVAEAEPEPPPTVVETIIVTPPRPESPDKPRAPAPSKTTDPIEPATPLEPTTPTTARPPGTTAKPPASAAKPAASGPPATSKPKRTTDPDQPATNE
jgi:starch synthase (maltosyl-transferring)